MPGAHAPLSPSAAKRWLSCPPSARLNAKLLDRFGEKSSTFAEEGTKAHSLSELKLRKETGEINAFRFGELKKSIGHVTQKVLTAQLRDMEAKGLLTRTVYAEVPPRVEYTLTDTGYSLKPILDSMVAWGADYQRKNGDTP